MCWWFLLIAGTPWIQLLARSLITFAQVSPFTELSLGPLTIVSAVIESPNNFGSFSVLSTSWASFFLHGALCVLQRMHIGQSFLLGKCVRKCLGDIGGNFVGFLILFMTGFGGLSSAGFCASLEPFCSFLLRLAFEALISDFNSSSIYLTPSAVGKSTGCNSAPGAGPEGLVACEHCSWP